jgi:flagellar basal body-associated protein FliL
VIAEARIGDVEAVFITLMALVVVFAGAVSVLVLWRLLRPTER